MAKCNIEIQNLEVPMIESRTLGAKVLLHLPNIQTWH